MLATTSRFSQSARSWKTVAMPRSSAALGFGKVTGLPLKVIVPPLGGWTPARILTSVDLPAPLSPTSATTSPARTSRSMSVNAETAPKCLETLRRLRTGSGLAAGAWGGSLIGFRLSSIGSPTPWVEGPPGLGRKRPDGPATRRDLRRNAQLLATFGIGARAQNGRGQQLLVDYLGLQVLGGDHRGREELRGRVIQSRFGFRGFARQQLDSNIGGSRRDDLAGLGDRVVLVARDDQLQRRNGRVVAGDRRHRIDTGRLECRDGAAARAVVRRDDAEDLRAEAGDLAAGPSLSVRRRPIRGVEFGEDRVARIVEAFVDALLDEAGRRVGGRAVDLENAARGRIGLRRLQMRDERIGDRLADALVVEGDVKVGLPLGDRTVVGDDLHALVARESDQRRGGGGIDRVEHDDLRALGDDRVELLLLLGGVRVGVLIEHRAVGAELLHLGNEAGSIVLFVAGRALVGHQEGYRRAGGGGGDRTGPQENRRGRGGEGGPGSK